MRVAPVVIQFCKADQTGMRCQLERRHEIVGSDPSPADNPPAQRLYTERKIWCRDREARMQNQRFKVDVSRQEFEWIFRRV
mgnify:CR=1 FL=1